MRLRIVAGDLGGRYIEAPAGRRTRPTAARVREAWFAAMGRDVVDARVADLYAGSGALGIEALSRGAAHVHFVETDRRTADTLDRNLRALGLTSRSRIVRRAALAWIAGVGERLDLVLADPPYGSAEAPELVERFRRRPFAKQLWIEHETRAGLADAADWTREYGDTRLSRFRSGARIPLPTP